MSNTTLNVSSAAELSAILGTLKGGETIVLAGGDYGQLRLSSWKGKALHFPETVTFQSADPDDPAVFSGMTLMNARNLAFEGITFDYTFQPGDTWLTAYPFTISSSRDITIRDSQFLGDDAYGISAALDGYGNGTGLQVRASSGVTLEGNEFAGWTRGLKLLQSNDIVVQDNEFHDQRMDNIVASEVRNVLIADNYMHDHRAAPDSTDHRDMIQFWTDRSKTQTSDVIIRDNIMVLGDNTIQSHSILLGNGAVTREGAGVEMYLKNFEITGNVIVNGHKNGISVDQADGLLIANNTLIRDVVEGGDDSPLYAPAINVRPESLNVTITDNVSSAVNGYAGQTDWSQSGNILIQDADPNQPNYYGDLFINAGVSTRSDLTHIQIKDGSLLDQTGAGSALLAFNDHPDTLTALFTTGRDAQNWTHYDFDAGFSAGPAGLLSASAVYNWDFGDGTLGRGQTAGHTYAQPGTYQVTLTVTQTDGTTDDTTTRVTIGNPEIARLDAVNGTFVFPGEDQQKGPDLDMVTTSDRSAQPVLVFAGDATQYNISKTMLDPIFGATDFRVDLSLRSDDWHFGDVFALSNSFDMTVLADGTLRARVTPQGQDRISLFSKEALQDGVWNDVSMEFDGEGGTFRLLIDGVVTAEKQVYGALPEMSFWGLTLGSVRNTGGGFTGEMASFDLQANLSRYPEPTTDLDPDLDLPAPVLSELLTFDSFDLIDTLAAPADDIALTGNATIQNDIIALDGKGDAVQLRGPLAASSGEAFTLDIDYHRDVANGGYVRLAWQTDRLALELKGDGLNLRVGTADQGFARFQIANLGLNDTDWHRIIASVDAKADVMTVLVDDVIVFNETTLDIDLSHGPANQNWYLGGAWTGYLDGEIREFHLSSMDPETLLDSLPLG